MWPFKAVTGVKVFVDHPRSCLLQNLSQDFSGWVVLPPGESGLMEWLIDGAPGSAQVFGRPAVEGVFRGCRVNGWTIRQDAAQMAARKRRTLTLEFRVAGRPAFARSFYKSRHLMPEDADSPLFFMHIPKTAGTALRHFVDI